MEDKLREAFQHLVACNQEHCGECIEADKFLYGRYAAPLAQPSRPETNFSLLVAGSLREKLDTALYNKHGGGSVSSRWTVNSILDAIRPIVEQHFAASQPAGLEAAVAEARRLVEKWRKNASSFEITCGDSEVEAAYYGCADELEAALERRELGKVKPCPICDGVGSHKFNCSLNQS